MKKKASTPFGVNALDKLKLLVNPDLG
jgi:hypothetical protein